MSRSFCRIATTSQSIVEKQKPKMSVSPLEVKAHKRTLYILYAGCTTIV
jgi:hypothetical protein